MDLESHFVPQKLANDKYLDPPKYLRTWDITLEKQGTVRVLIF